MKKTIFSMIAIAMAAFSFTACEDVPAPYDTPNNEGGTEIPDVKPSGDGTEANPFNAAAALEYASSLEADVESDKVVYIKGKVSSIKENFGDSSYGNASFYISDDGSSTKQFYVFRALYLGNKKYTEGDKLKVGDEVVVCGKVTNYKGNTPETVANSTYLVSLNGKSEGGSDNPGTDTGVATGDGTQANPFNSVAANKYASSLAENAESDKDVYIKGKVVSIKENYGDSSYGNATFYISDDGTATDQFYVYRALYIGNKKYESGAKLAVGDSVVVCGRVTNYMGYMGSTPETVANKAWLVSIKTNGGDNPGTDIEGTTYDVSKLFDTTTELSTVTMKDGLKLTFDGGGNTNAPKFYTTGGGAIRVYPKNTIKVEASKKIKALQFVCDDYQGGYTASGDVTASTGGKPTLEGTKLTFTGINATTVTFTNVSQQTDRPSQMRIKQIIVAYE